MIESSIFHNSHDLSYRKPFGAVDIGKYVSISIDVDIDAEVYLNLIKFDLSKYRKLMIKEDDKSNRFNIEINTDNLCGVNNYYFEIIYNNEIIYYGNNEDELGGIGKQYVGNPKTYQLTVYKERKVPSWYKEGIIYQIFVDRFCNGNDDGKINNPKRNSFIYGNWDDDPMYIKDEHGNVVRWDFYGGNLRGIIKKLSYIKSLGASIIYMNPIFEAISCHKYDTGDYEKIDEMFGTEEDFKALCYEAKKLDMKIILDGVFSHTGSDSKYFNKYGNYDTLGAYQSKESRYYNWYRFNEYPDKYECWWGFNNQPNIDELNEDYINYIVKDNKSIISKWMNLGTYGWRLDVADELPDEFIKIIKDKMLNVNNDSVLIGEVWEDASNKVSYSKRREYFFGDELDSVTNYPLRDVIIKCLTGSISTKYFAKRIMSLYENYPIENFYSNINLLGNHDTERIFTMLEEDKELLKLAITIQMTIPGVPLIYYGDEVGLTGGKDPYNRKTYPWESPNTEILDIYKRLIGIRNNEEVLKKGDFKFIDNTEGLIIYKRMYMREMITIIINPYNKKIDYKLIGIEKLAYDLIDNNKCEHNNNKYINIELNKREFKIIKSII
ncbi:glycoside hydrolase family 13 protein [Clostridium sardiniense]|uniref:Glycoside hydrolase family 13 protein n=1 Tax=Clostridium sardiniense TaxID=29369 RepID=A0ABS7L3B9_CLOSR|nr:glycoside hydrolase family 13 protein [Clostridium sardiniense]MBY0757437.1 glycoside hydrolase family 13 protein [Clostridium sardiniense]MDQ0462165.1 pullulanase [Clostridium sardiniense]